MKKNLISEQEWNIESLFSLYGDGILRMCYLYLHDIYMAEDALQETFIRAYSKRGSFRGEASPKTWICRIAINVCKNMRRGRREVLSTEDVRIEELLPTREEDQAGRMTVSDEIAKLPIKYREVILLYYYQELPMKSIAEVLHIPQTTAAYRLRQGKALLKPTLKEAYFDE